jgi:hypothetical protein
MLNVFKYFEKPDELDKSELHEYMHLLEELVDEELGPEDESSLEPILNIIKNDPEYAYYYAKDILSGHRWIEAEPVIMKDPWSAYMYAKYVLDGPWGAAEPYIMKSSEYAYWYANSILNKRWEKAEPYIKNDEYYWNKYRDKFNIDI